MDACAPTMNGAVKINAIESITANRSQCDEPLLMQALTAEQAKQRNSAFIPGSEARNFKPKFDRALQYDIETILISKGR